VNQTPLWPDRATYSAVVQVPDQVFDDPQLRGATFARNRGGQVLVWSGGRAIVFRADCADGGSIAVRFFLSDDRHAGVRYDALSRHLSSTPVDSFVRTTFLNDGLRLGATRYPLLKMEWVDGTELDKYVDHRIKSGADGVELGRLAAAWIECCRSRVAASIGHGDIHAGNTLVSGGPAAPRLRLVDYDSVWVPGLYAPTGEMGSPAFQHPERDPAKLGRYMDSFPNALTYLSLAGLAGDVALWQYRKGDDQLLFDSHDLGDPNREVWSALLDSSDPMVCSMARLVRQWLGEAPEQYLSLDHFIATAGSARKPPAPGARNTWPPHGQWEPAARQRPAERHWRAAEATQTWPPPAGTAVGHQTWEPQPIPVRAAGRVAKRNRTGRYVAVVVVLVLIAVVILASL
jgi:hypothetical protein